MAKVRAKCKGGKTKAFRSKAAKRRYESAKHAIKRSGRKTRGSRRR